MKMFYRMALSGVLAIFTTAIFGTTAMMPDPDAGGAGILPPSAPPSGFISPVPGRLPGRGSIEVDFLGSKPVATSDASRTV
jgi:hypothetical protein